MSDPASSAEEARAKGNDDGQKETAVPVTQNDAPPSSASEQRSPTEAPPGSYKDFIERVTDSISDPSLQKELWDRFGNLMKSSVEARETMARLSEQNAVLKKTNDNMAENNRVSADQMIRVMDDLYKRFAPSASMSEETRKAATKELSNNPHLMEVMRSVPVMASAIKDRDLVASKSSIESAKSNHDLQKGLAESRAAVSYYEKMLSDVSGIQEPPKLWETPAPVPVMASAGASGSGEELSNKRKRLVPDWLSSQCGSYDNANMSSQRIFAADYDHPDRLHGSSRV